MIDIDVLLDVYAENSWLDGHPDNYTSLHNRWFRISCTALVENGLKYFTIHNIAPYQRGTNSLFEYKLDDSLLPYLRDTFEKETDIIAEGILNKYFPNFLNEAQAINPYEFASLLGLTIEYRKITEDFSVYGRIYFEDDIFNNIPAKTIVIDSELADKRNQSTVNIAIVHECIHWILHRLAIELEKGSNAISDDNNLIKWVEQQAWTIVPKVMMPKIATQKLVKNYFEEWRREEPGIQVSDIVDRLIRRIASTFGVPAVSAKKRLAELGIEEARGALEYVDGRYIPKHSWSQGFLGINQTFTIGTYDLAKLLRHNETLRSRLENGSLVYVESHVCLNDARYVDETGTKIQLTSYARTHMDECCLVFDKNRGITSSQQRFTLVKLLNNALEPRLSPQYQYQSNPSNLGIEEEASLLMKQGKVIRKIKAELPKTSFGDCLKYLRKWRKVNNEELAKDALLSATYISRLQNNKVKDITLRTVVALCIAMSLPYEVCVEFISLSGRSLRTLSEDEDMLYNLFLMATENYTVEHCNNILIECKLPNLTEKNEIH
ncbi:MULTISPECIES: helix-turn-helix domain-containing protein [Streptococcus]|uniref:helix-turn-helix domain-containing protein n=1 Tax=Streptococcus TaxID=1301 RepID=UPI0012DC9455|nr:MULTISPECIES: helix-turn-helix domain-containing protein [Streptococcus]